MAWKSCMGYFNVPKTVTDKRGWLESQYRKEWRALAEKNAPLGKRCWPTGLAATPTW